MKPYPVLIIPGLLGSELELSGWRVWSDQARFAARTIFNPALLMPWVRLQAGSPLEQYYGPLANRLVRMGYIKGQDLFLFGYDWRVGIDEAAQLLANFFNEKVHHGSQVILVAHSLGCLVARMAITEGLISSVKLKEVFAAGPPMLGAAMAFQAMIEMPPIHKVFDRALRLAKTWAPSFASQIETPVVKALMTTRSVLELMPPETLPVFRDRAGQSFTAYQWAGWPEALKSQLHLARLTQDRLAQGVWPEPVPRTLIYSDEIPTDLGFEIDNTSPNQILRHLTGEPGDGTVLAESAKAFEFDKSICVNAGHDELLICAETLRYLDSQL